MDRIAYFYKVKPNKLDEYIKAHKEIWPEQVELLKKSGVKKMVIFNRGNDLFLYSEIDDVKRYHKIRRASEVDKRWSEYMDTLLVKPFDSKEPSAFAELKEIWKLEED